MKNEDLFPIAAALASPYLAALAAAGKTADHQDMQDAFRAAVQAVRVVLQEQPPEALAAGGIHA